MQESHQDSLVINFITGAEVKHVNLRKQGSEDDPAKAVDIKLSGECSNTCLPKILGCDLEQITSSYWANDDARNPLFSGITDVKTWAEFEDCDLEIDSRPFSQVKIKNIRFKPVSNLKVLLTLSASISNVSNNELAVIANLLHEKTGCIIVGQPELDLKVSVDDKSKKKAKDEQQGFLSLVE